MTSFHPNQNLCSFQAGRAAPRNQYMRDIYTSCRRLRAGWLNRPGIPYPLEWLEPALADRFGWTIRMHRRPAMWTLLALAALHAERLPVKTYTSSDGLAHDVVYRITQDRRGFLWICTEEGLSRFDGYEFKNYTAAEGLPRDAVTDLLETRHGDYWVATAEGLYRFDPAGGRKFTRIDPVPARVLLEDRSGKIWCGTRRGLYQLVEGALHEIEIGLPRTSADSAAVRVLLEDRDRKSTRLNSSH